MRVESGKVITVDFELRDAQGELIQEKGSDPIVYLHGADAEVFPKIQEALDGKEIGEEVYVQLEPEDAFGDFDPELMRIEEMANFPEDLEIGMQLEEVPTEGEDEADLKADDENTGFGRLWTVTDIAEGKVVLDGNHPFAGIALRYALKVVDIREASAEEIAVGAATQSLFSVAPNPDASKLH